jgi:erythrocyte band 7 integral membrane protein
MDSIPSQSVMTCDNVSVSIDSVICYAIENPYRATYGIDNVRSALIERAQTTLR